MRMLAFTRNVGRSAVALDQLCAIGAAYERLELAVPQGEQRTAEGVLYTKLTGNRVKCSACAHRCTILPGLDGICRVRSNRAGSSTAGPRPPRR